MQNPLPATDLSLPQMELIVSDVRQLYAERNAARSDLEQAHLEILQRLCLAASYHDDDTGTHIQRIGHLAARLALLTGIEPSYAELLRNAAPMHDIGKMGIPDSILKKPGPLTATERTVMQQHPLIGEKILQGSSVPLLRMAAEVAVSHHEQFNGSGYPHGLVGHDIPLSGRLVAIVDFVDALTMARCYRPALSEEQALTMVAEQRGRAFDPMLVDGFLHHADELMALRRQLS